MRRWLGALGLLLVALLTWGCQNEDPTQPTTIINQNVNTVNLGGTGSSPVPGGPSGTCAALHLGCDSMVSPGGISQPGCGAQLADYSAPAGTVGRLDATPVGADGAKLNGFSVSGWAAVGACTLEGDTFGQDGFTPTIHIQLGECIVSVGVTGCPPAQRKFIGQ